MAGNISDQTTVFSNVSVDLAAGGNFSANTVLTKDLTVTGTVVANLTISDTTGTISAGTLTAPFVAATTNVVVGGGTAITGIRKGTISVVTLTCTAAGSTETTATVSPLATTDAIFVNPQSSLSSGVVVHARVSAASTVILTFSNMSTANNVIGGPCVLNYVAIRS